MDKEDKELRAIFDKVEKGEKLTDPEFIELFTCKEISNQAIVETLNKSLSWNQNYILTLKSLAILKIKGCENLPDPKDIEKDVREADEALQYYRWLKRKIIKNVDNEDKIEKGESNVEKKDN